jgi:hypothetical protein
VSQLIYRPFATRTRGVCYVWNPFFLSATLTLTTFIHVTRYEYKTASAFLADFELMKNNAVKFNGMNSTLANEATAIVEMVTKNIELDREELEMMEEAVREQLTGSSSGKKKN